MQQFSEILEDFNSYKKRTMRELEELKQRNEELENEYKESNEFNEKRLKEKYKALYEYLRAEDLMKRKNLRTIAKEVISAIGLTYAG